MKRRAFLLALVCVGCHDPVELVTGPTLYFERWDAQRQCFAACGVLPAPPPALGLESCPPLEDDEGPECKLRQASDKLRVTAHYVGLEFEDLAKVTAPTLKFELDDVLQTPEQTLVREELAGEHAHEYAAVTQFDVPAQQARRLALLVGSGTYERRSDPIPLQLPELLDLRVGSCNASGCPAIPSGVGEVDLVVEASNGLGTQATILSKVRGQTTEHTVHLKRVDHRLVGGTRIEVPTAAGEHWRFEGTIGTYQLPVRDVVLDPPATAVLVDGCTDPTCELVAGISRVTVWVRVPEKLRNQRVLISSVLDDIEETTPSEATPFTTEAGFAIHRMDLTAPKQPGREWRLRARVGDLPPVTARPIIRLRGPRDARIVFVAPDSTLPQVDFSSPVSTIRRAAGEVLARCRDVGVAVLLADEPRATVRLKAFGGLFDNGAAELQAQLDETGKLLVPLRLEEAPQARNVAVQVLLGDAFRGATSWRLDEIWPTGGQLLTARSTLEVGADGTPEAQLTGRLYAPNGALFPVGTQVALSLQATREATQSSLACGLPIAPELLNCQPGGGCLLSPRVVTVDADGSFTVPLTKGLCFVGQVTVTARARTGADAPPDTCLSERQVSTEPLPVGVLGLKFVPKP
ncbi:hypothetical protein LY474_00800 [Myxococcus stipitatus]|uniref:hypothetical protein n=1 Tax=Myxococcus stipitatus TaxID=83455 RepID=UPI001F160C16|nr:hypothetical protein [Myxococcus stipitatus]MCE9666335.1 hypothetical protein [Myxococcus stipitatus]